MVNLTYLLTYSDIAHISPKFCRGGEKCVYGLSPVCIESSVFACSQKLRKLCHIL